jgi:predicted DsbA family dithiol-disulfide isomerase
MTTGQPPSVQVDVYFDLICPWCWIGKAHLSTARRLLAEQRPDTQLQLRWHSVQLIPDVPRQGWPYQAFYEHRLGGPDAVRARRAQVQAAAADAGLSIHHEKIAIFPNTWQAHRLLAFTEKQQPQAYEGLLDALFEAYFVQGSDLGNDRVLAELAQAHGVNNLQVDTFDAPPIWALPPDASGVPLFVFNQYQVVSGAQPAQVLLAALQQSLRPSLAKTYA